MAVTSIWRVKGWLGKLVIYVENPDKTTNPKSVKAEGLEDVLRYAVTLGGTRIYLEVRAHGDRAMLSMKNISRQQLNLSPDELMERFVRGDSSRNTEGSGLGLNIARSLVELQNGTFDLSIDGDLFKVILTLPLLPSEEIIQ